MLRRSRDGTSRVRAAGRAIVSAGIANATSTRLACARRARARPAAFAAQTVRRVRLPAPHGLPVPCRKWLGQVRFLRRPEHAPHTARPAHGTHCTLRASSSFACTGAPPVNFHMLVCTRISRVARAHSQVARDLSRLDSGRRLPCSLSLSVARGVGAVCDDPSRFSVDSDDAEEPPSDYRW